jgi:hypothetical protein
MDKGFIEMSTLSLKTKSYDVQRSWADQYEPMMNNVAGTILFADPKLLSVYFTYSQYQDRKQGVDMQLVLAPTRFSYRVREAKYKEYFLNEFTIRNTARYGPSELEKIQTDNYASFLLYACAHPSEYGVIDCAVMIDLGVLGSQLVAYPHLIEKAVKKNGFISFEYDSFPSDIVCGTWNLKRKGT